MLLVVSCVGTACGGAVAEGDGAGTSSGGELSLGGTTFGQGSSKGGAAGKSSSSPRGGTYAYSSSTYTGASASPGKGGTVSTSEVTGTTGGGPSKGGTTSKSSSAKGGNSNRGGTTATGGRAAGGSSQGGSVSRGGTSSQGGSVSFGGSSGGSPMVGIAGTGWVSVGVPRAGAAGAPAEWLDTTIYVARDLTPTDTSCTNGTARWLGQLSTYLSSVRRCTADTDCTEVGLSTACGVICPMPINRRGAADFRQGVYDEAQTVCSSCPRFTTPDCMSRVSQTLCVGGICRSGD